MCGGSGCKYEDFWGFCSVRYPYPADAECMIAAGLPDDDQQDKDQEDKDQEDKEKQNAGFGKEE